MTPIGLMALFLVLVNAASAVLFFRAARRSYRLKRTWWGMVYAIGVLSSVWATAVYLPVALGFISGLSFEWGRSVTFALSIINFGMALFSQLRGDEIR